MIRGRKFEHRFAPHCCRGRLAADVRVDRAGNRPFDLWGTGCGALTSITSGAVNPSSPKVNGTIYATAADGLGGFYIGGSFACIGPNTSGSCNHGSMRRQPVLLLLQQQQSLLT